MKRSICSIAAITLMAAAFTTPAFAKGEEVTLAKCEKSHGTIAVVDGDTQGWSEYGLGSPRELINALALESGCFTPVNPASGAKADFLMNVIAGDKEEVDKSVDLAKGAATEALLRSGALSSIASKIPIGGALLGAFGGLGGKRRTVAAGIKMISPANGQTIALGTGEVKKSSISFNNGSGGWVGGAQSAGYASSKDGKMIVEAFVIAFNDIAAQAPNLAAYAVPAAPGAQTEMARAAVDTIMRAAPSATADEVRKLRSGTTVTPTGKREGKFIEVADNFGTKGWVSVEDLK